jgi:hypothetical protein
MNVLRAVPQEDIEDTKGNNGQPGKLSITQLRVVWVSNSSQRVNLSIGWGCVTAVSIARANSRLKGELLMLAVNVHGHCFICINQTLGPESSVLRFQAPPSRCGC